MIFKRKTPEQLMMEQQLAMEQMKINAEMAERLGGQHYISQNRDEMKDIISITLDVEVIIKQLEYELRGYEMVIKRSESGEPIEVWEQTGEPIMNEKGIGAVISFVNSFIGKNAILSVFKDEKDILRKCNQIGDDLSDLCEEKHENYEIDARRIAPTIMKITHLIELSLRRAWGKERNLAYGSVKATEHRHFSDEQQQKGFMGRMMGNNPMFK